jgi:hypothetical protein
MLKAEGRHLEKVATAKKLLAMGLDAAKVVEATDLSKAEVKAISDDLKSSKH